MTSLSINRTLVAYGYDRQGFFDDDELACLRALATVLKERSHLLDAYLEAWTVFAPRDSLHELWQQIQPVLALHHLISYHSIAHHIEPTQRQDLAEMIPYFARKTIDQFTIYD